MLLISLDIEENRGFFMNTKAKEVTKIKFRPMSDRILLKREKSESETIGGIILPDNAKKKQETAKVVAIGPGKTNDGKLVSPTVQNGDTVLVEKNAGQEVTIENEEYIVVRNDDVIAIIES
jgi:chaperonin GroES